MRASEAAVGATEATEAAPGVGRSPELAAAAAANPATTDGAGLPVLPVARRRRRQTTPRPHAVFARFSDEEFEELAVAAALVGVTPTSYVASTSVAVARGQVRPMPSGVGDVVRELVEARAQLVSMGCC